MALVTERPDPHAGESMVGPHGQPDDHGADHGHDDHAHGGIDEPGPVEIATWAMALLGIVLGLAVAVAFVLGAS
jgi:hypothetical protein